MTTVRTETTDGIRARQREGWPSVGDDDPVPARVETMRAAGQEARL